MVLVDESDNADSDHKNTNEQNENNGRHLGDRLASIAAESESERMSLEFTYKGTRRPSRQFSELSESTFDEDFYDDEWGDRIESTGLELFGREAETNALREAYDRVGEGGSSEIILIEGSPGSGKSALVNQSLRAYAVQNNGYFVEGKFDLLSGAAPFSAISAAFTDLCDLLLQSDQIEAVRVAINEAFTAEEIAILNRVVSTVSYVAGIEDSHAHEQQHLQGNTTQVFVRFKLLCSLFLETIANNKPVVLFMDDLQWAQPQTLDVLKTLVQDPKLGHTLLVCTYRLNEFDPQQLCQPGVETTFRKTHMVIDSLPPDSLNQMVSSM